MLNVSVLTSFSARGIIEAAGTIRKLGIPFVELYAFMNEDLPALWPTPPEGLTAPENALSYMAAAQTVPGDAARVAGVLSEWLDGSKITGVATYLPEIGAPERFSALRRDAQRALRFLVDLVTELRKLGHLAATIEIVAGSTVEGIWRCVEPGQADTFILNRADEVASVAQFLSAMEPVADYACGRRVRFGVELEPGPLFSVGSLGSLLRLIGAVNQARSDSIRKTIHLNVDLPHIGFLSRVDPEWMVGRQVVMERIAHAHISDHSSGHFCDLEPFEFHSVSEFLPWLVLLDKAPGYSPSGDGLMGFDGFVTCELEACREEAVVRRSLEYVRGLLARL